MNFKQRMPVERAAERGQERKRAADDSANELRDLIEIMPAMAFAVRPDGSWEFVSRRWQEYSGLSPEAATCGFWEATVHHQAAGHRHGPVHQSKDCRVAWRPLVGQRQHRTRRDLSVQSANRGGSVLPSSGPTEVERPIVMRKSV